MFARLDVACLDIRSIPKVLLQPLQRKTARVQLRLIHANMDFEQVCMQLGLQFDEL